MPSAKPKPKPEPEPEPETTTKDLTGTVPGLWPGNPTSRIGSYYFNLQKLPLDKGETGLLCALPECFVFERMDMHGIAAPDTPLEIELTLEKFGSAGVFRIEQGQKTVRQTALSNVNPGTHAGKHHVFITAIQKIPDKGRILLNIIGYQIQPWR